MNGSPIAIKKGVTWRESLGFKLAGLEGRCHPGRREDAEANPKYKKQGCDAIRVEVFIENLGETGIKILN